MAGTDEDKKDATEEVAPKVEEEEASKAPGTEEADKKDAPTTTTEQQVVSDPETLSHVAERLKFFFSNANIRGDRFMQNQINIRGPDSGKRPVPIEVLLRFNTLKKYTTDPQVVMAAAQQLLSEQLVVVQNNNNDNNNDSSSNSTAGAALRRVHSFTMEMMNDNVPKTLVVSNLPIQKKENANAAGEEKEDDDDEATYAVSMDDIRKVFEEFGPVAMIRMRFGPSPKQLQQQQQAKKKDNEGEEEHHHHDHSRHDASPGGRRVQYRYPAQYAFVEYETTADCEKALAEVLTTTQQGGDEDVEHQPKQRKLQLGGNELQVTSLQDYMDQQKLKRQAKKENTKSALTTPQDKQKAAIGGDGDGGSTEKENVSSSAAAAAAALYTIDWKPGCVIKLEGLADGCDREAIMTAVATAMEYSTVDALKDDQLVYVDYSRGQTTGAIRFFEPNDKIKMLLSKLYCPTSTTTTASASAATASTDASGDDDKQEKKLAEGGGDEGKAKVDDDTAATVIKIAGAQVERAYLLEGEQEEKYWKEFIDFKNHQKKRQAESSSEKQHHHHHHHNNNRGKHQHHHRNSKRQKRR
jgi:xRRM domain